MASDIHGKSERLSIPVFHLEKHTVGVREHTGGSWIHEQVTFKIDHFTSYVKTGKIFITLPTLPDVGCSISM